MKDLSHHKSGDSSVENRRICPFISSSFVDLEEEFKYLHTEVFVNLNKLYNTYGCQFSCVDHRRTAVDSRQTSDYILKNALDNLLACSPFFMCIIGGQYGTHRSPDCKLLSDNTLDLNITKSMPLIDRNFLTAANHGHDWVLDPSAQLCSILELEIALAAFKPREFPNHCYFYIKDYYQSYLNQTDVENIGKQNTHSIVEDEFGTVFEMESEYAKRRFDDMIRRIVNIGFPIKFFTSKEDLGNAIIKDWSQLMYKLYQKPPAHFIQSDDFFTQKWAIQSFTSAYQKKYLKYPDLEKIENMLYGHVNSVIFIPNKHEDEVKNISNEANAFESGDGLFSSSKSFVQSIRCSYDEKRENEKKIFTLVGDPGIGKSTLLANWIQDFQQNFPDVVVIQEFVGSSVSSYDLVSFMRKCIRTIREKYWKKRCTPSESLSEVEMWEGLVQSFHYAIQLLPCVLLIDSINDLKFAMDKDIGTLKSLCWLPQEIPKNCRMIFSSRQSDLTYQMLNNRKDVVMQRMPRLRQSVREKLFQLHYRNDVVQFLGREHLEKIWINRLSEKPLFITALSDLLRSSRDTNDINQIILKCTAFRIFRDFWKSVFILWSRRYSWNKQSSGQPGSIRVRSTAAGWVADTLKMIATSRGGLYASEIVHLLMLIGYRGRATVTLHDFDLFLQAAGSALMVRQDGLINIAHEDIKIALGHCLLGTGIHSSTSPSASSRSENKQRQLHLLLASFFLKYGSIERKLTQLPWHLNEGKDYNFLCQVLSKPRFFIAICKESRQNPSMYVDLLIYWRELTKRDFKLPHCIELMLEQAKNEQTNLLHPGNKDDTRRASGVEQQPPAEGSKWKQLALKGPSMIIVTQHDDAQMSRTEESRSETEERDFSETESCSFFLTENEPDSHQLVSGWSPAEECPEHLIDTTLLDYNELATLYHDVTWLLFHLGKPFFEDAKAQLQISRDYLNSMKPFSTVQFLAMFNLTCTEICYVENMNPELVKEAVDIFQSLPINTLEFSFIEKKNIMEANGMLKLCLARKYIDDGDDEKAHSLILDTFNTMRTCESIPGQGHTTCVFGKLLASQDLTVQAEAMLNKAHSTFIKWFGPKHISVAHVLCEQGKFHSKSALLNGLNTRPSMLAYKSALDILKFNNRTVEYGEVVNIIGELLSKEGSLRSKEEAKDCFLQAHDIFVTSLDKDSEKLLQIANNYKEISNDLRKGKYAHGGSKPPDIRTSERPFSSLSYHEWELKQIASKESQFSLASSQHMRRRSLQESISPATDRPYSSFSTRSVGKYVLVTPKDNNVRKIKSANARMYQSWRSTSFRNSTLSPVSYREKNWDKQALEDKLTGNGPRDPLKSTPVSPYTQERLTTSEGKEVPVVIVPAGRNSRLSVKLDLEDFQRASKHQFDDNLDSVYRTEVVAGSEQTSNSARRRRNSHHEQKCNYQSGPDKLSLTIHGPHSSVSDILPPPPSPRLNVRSSGITHKSAWFHVPGRYPKPGQILPSKRSQRPDSASSTLLRTTIIGRMDDNTSLKSGRKSNVTASRRHSSPVVQHSNMHVAFDRSIQVESIASTNYNYPIAQNTPAPSLTSN